MNTIDKHTALLKALADKTTLLQRCQRFTCEQKFPPYFRTFIAMGSKMEKKELDELDALAEEHALLCNPFRTPDGVSAITFVDYDEKRPN